MNDVPAAEGEAGEAYARRKRALTLAAPVVVVMLAGFLGTAFMPYLLARAPLVLVALSPIFRHLVLASRVVDAVPLFLIAVPRHFFPDIFVYLLGREFGRTALEWVEANSPSSGRFVRMLERLFSKAGVLVLLVSPDLVVSTLAGIARLPPALFVGANIAGTIGTVVVARFFGDVFDGPIRAILAFFQAHLALVTLASVLIVVVLNWHLKRRNEGVEGSRGPGVERGPEKD
jgi:membrane protein DedA with SNARE-associated domain